MVSGSSGNAVTFKIKGHVVEKDTGAPLQGLLVKAYDKDVLFDDVLGSARTDAKGAFEIFAEEADFRELFDARPDLYFKVYAADGETLVHSTKDRVLKDRVRAARLRIEVPWDALHPPTQASVTLAGEDGRPVEAVEVGDSLTVQAKGLRPVRAYDVAVLSGGRPLFTSRLITDRDGDLPSTVLWPQVGLDDPASAERLTPDQALERWQDRTLDVVLSLGREKVAAGAIRIGKSSNRPLVLATDAAGRLLNGFEVGTSPLFLTVRNVRAEGPVRVFLVPRQHDWNVGDAFEPATLAGGEPAVRDVELPSGGRQAVLELFAAADLRPGAYDFILRPLRYGSEENEARRVLDADVVGSRRITGLVVRERFMQGKTVLGGCVNKLPISGRSVPGGAPYFRYSDTFAVGEDVWAALDPGIVDPNNVGKMCALYVIPNKTEPQWNADNSLNHLAVLGGNAAAQRIKVQAGCVNMNKVLLWPNALQPGEYDIVVDFGNNTPDAASFTPDHQYNTPLDVIDGYFLTGFRVVRDPGTMQDWTHVGSAHYQEADVDALGLQGTTTVDDENGGYATPGGFSVLTRTVRLRARVFFPADAPGVTSPSLISAAKPSYPLAIVVHGNGHDYTSYDFLLQHLARNGFIAASIENRFVGGSGLQHGMHGLGRANNLFKHIPVLQALFGTKAQNNIGLLGHSRGGEGILKAARLNQQLGLGHGINALLPLAPTDQYGTETLGGAYAKPLLVVYGSRDGDVAGWSPYAGYTVQQTGFSLYDRAGGERKSMAFVYRASHNGFITTDSDAMGGDLATMLPTSAQRSVVLAYTNALFRRFLLNEPEWEGVLTGEWRPPSVDAAGVELYTQFRRPGGKTVDDFQSAPAWSAGSLGGTVTHGGTLPADPQEGKLYDVSGSPGLDPFSPHDTKGMRLRWDNVGDQLVFSVPAAHKDVSAFTHLSFRIAQKAESASNPVNQPQDLRVVLRDGAGNERAVRVSPFGRVPYPDPRSMVSLRKSALATVRIPLTSYTIVCAGQPKVDLADVVTLAFRFSERPQGEVEIDEIEFTD